MPELKLTQHHLNRALGYLSPTNPHPTTDVVRAQLPALRDRLQHLIVDVGLVIELQIEGEKGAPNAEP